MIYLFLPSDLIGRSISASALDLLSASESVMMTSISLIKKNVKLILKKLYCLNAIILPVDAVGRSSSVSVADLLSISAVSNFTPV